MIPSVPNHATIVDIIWEKCELGIHLLICKVIHHRLVLCHIEDFGTKNSLT